MIEIGEAKQIESQYLLHIRGTPLKEALLIDALMNKGYTQHDIAREMELSQGQISKRLKLLTLSLPLLELLKDGKILPSIAYALSKLRPGKQKEFSGRSKITLGEVQSAHRSETITPQIMELLSEPQENETPPISGTELESEWKKASIEYREPHGDQEVVLVEKGIRTAIKGLDLIIKGADGREHIINAKYIRRSE